MKHQPQLPQTAESAVRCSYCLSSVNTALHHLLLPPWQTANKQQQPEENHRWGAGWGVSKGKEEERVAVFTSVLNRCFRWSGKIFASSLWCINTHQLLSCLPSTVFPLSPSQLHTQLVVWWTLMLAGWAHRDPLQRDPLMDSEQIAQSSTSALTNTHTHADVCRPAKLPWSC